MKIIEEMVYIENFGKLDGNIFLRIIRIFLFMRGAKRKLWIYFLKRASSQAKVQFMLREKYLDKLLILLIEKKKKTQFYNNQTTHMETKLVVFDLAGTTVFDENFVALAIMDALKNVGVQIEIEDANKVMGIPKPQAINFLLQEKTGNDYEENSKFVKMIHKQFLSNMIRFYRESDQVREIDGVSETFSYLKDKGIKVAVNTGFSSDITEAIIKKMGWREKNLLQFWASSDMVKRGRPFPDMIFYLMKKAKVECATNVAKVGDTIADILEGQSAGCGKVIAVLSGAGKIDELKRKKPSFIIKSVHNILSDQII
jgi:phosphonatase-like hydrolase